MTEKKLIEGKIYKIVDNTNNNVYIGSTKQLYLSNRLAHHRYFFKKCLENKPKYYLRSHEILKNNDYTAEIIEVYKCYSRVELLQREQYYINNTP